MLSGGWRWRPRAILSRIPPEGKWVASVALVAPHQLRELQQFTFVQIRDSPVFHLALDPVNKLVALRAERLAGSVSFFCRGPQEEIDRVLVALVDQGSDRA